MMGYCFQGVVDWENSNTDCHFHYCTSQQFLQNVYIFCFGAIFDVSLVLIFDFTFLYYSTL